MSSTASVEIPDRAALGELLDELPNLYVEIGAVIAELGRQPRYAAQFLEKYQDRVLFGKALGEVERPLAGCSGIDHVHVQSE